MSSPCFHIGQQEGVTTQLPLDLEDIVWTDENQNGHEENRNTTLEYLHDLTIT
jgi:hypothetical protein